LPILFFCMFAASSFPPILFFCMFVAWKVFS
jgi:hypothetical protein